MCLTRPVQIKKISGGLAMIGAGKTVRKIDVSLIKNPRVGDWVLSQADLAMEKISSKEAKKILKLLS